MSYPDNPFQANDDGQVTAPFIVTVALTLLLIVMVANMLSIHYASGVLRTATEEAARQGTVAGHEACLERFAAITDGLGVMGDGIGEPMCIVHPSGTAVTVDAEFTSWLPFVPATSVRETATVEQDH